MKSEFENTLKNIFSLDHYQRGIAETTGLNDEKEFLIFDATDFEDWGNNSYRSLERFLKFPLNLFSSRYDIIKYEIAPAAFFRIQVSIKFRGEDTLSMEGNHKPPFVGLRILVDANNWTGPVTINTLRELFKSAIEKAKYKYSFDYYFETPWFSPAGEIGLFIFKLNDDEETLNYMHSKILSISEYLIKEVQSQYPKEIQVLKDSETSQFQATFNFPEEIRTPCMQYMVYFGQFLADLGLDASTSINGHAREVLFTVVPNSPHDALEKIIEALEIFINIPSNLDSFEKSKNKDVSVNELKANVFHLKGQIELQKALIQAKDATIDALNLSNYIIRGGNHGLQHEVHESENLKIFNGLLEVKKYEGKGFNINLPAILKMLRRKK